MNNTVSYKVSLGRNSYHIFIGNKILGSISNYIKGFNDYSKIILVTDKNICKYNPKVIQNLVTKNPQIKKIVLPFGEKVKSFEFLNYLVEKILVLGIDRNSLIICLGGGVIGDLASLASSLVLRGIDFVQIPSTLLAQVDSSVGGKTGINSKYGKNLIGTFKQPKSVLISTELLKTLKKREIISGYAEILKYAFIEDKKFFEWLIKNGEKVIKLDTKSCIYAIKRSCTIKAKIVSIDEKEKGIREILNFGHTFGHAIESFTNYSGKIKHGESIFMGMYLAIKFSIFMKLCCGNILEKYTSHLEEIGISYRLEDFGLKINIKDFIKHIKFDKKIKKNKIKFILLKKIGTPVRIFLNDEKILSNFLKNELK